MPTKRQIEASRANGAKSRGPITPEGKAASSRNALKTGLYSQSQVITGEDPAALDSLAESYRERFPSTGPEAQALLAIVLNDDWLLRRLRAIEGGLWETRYQTTTSLENSVPRARAFAYVQEQLRVLQRRIDSTERSFHRALAALLKLQPPAAKPAALGSFAQIAAPGGAGASACQNQPAKITASPALSKIFSSNVQSFPACTEKMIG